MGEKKEKRKKEKQAFELDLVAILIPLCDLEQVTYAPEPQFPN